jgi:predicted DNA-binding protein
MPTVTIRLSAAEKADLESAARRSGQTLSGYVRSTLTVREDLPDMLERFAVFAERLERLERLAHLD